MTKMNFITLSVGLHFRIGAESLNLLVTVFTHSSDWWTCVNAGGLQTKTLDLPLNWVHLVSVA